VDAIFPEDEVPEAEQSFIAANAEFFGPAVTGWGEPGGASDQWTSAEDHPLVAGHAPGARRSAGLQ
jgi:ferredoxin